MKPILKRMLLMLILPIIAIPMCVEGLVRIALGTFSWFVFGSVGRLFDRLYCVDLVEKICPETI